MLSFSQDKQRKRDAKGEEKVEMKPAWIDEADEQLKVDISK